MKKILEISHLFKFINKREILKDINFSIYENEIVGFLGPNGAGKSTTMKCISGIYFPTYGTIKINGCDVIKEHCEAMLNLGVSIENPTLYPHLNGYEHLQLVGAYKSVEKKRIEEMEKFSGLKNRLESKTQTYSLGMKQRLALSLALLNQPKLVILDEPTNGLDPQAAFELREQLKEIKKQGSSILISSHILGEIEKISDRIIFINEGKIVDEVKTKDIINCYLRYQLSTSDNEKAQLIIRNIEGSKIDVFNNSIIECQFDSEKCFSLTLRKLTQKVDILYIEKLKMDLESYYKKVYGVDNEKTI